MSRHQFRSRGSIRDWGNSRSTSHRKQGSDSAAHSLLRHAPAVRPRASRRVLTSQAAGFHASRISRTYLCPFCGPDRLQTRVGSGSEPHRSRIWAHSSAPCFRSGTPTSLRSGVASSEPHCRHYYPCSTSYARAFSSSFYAVLLLLPRVGAASSLTYIHSSLSLVTSIPLSETV